ncbi:PilZ domain-containing protein [Sphingomonas sp. MMS24-J13]|uniref:PilZ domain-containing protein n=1 Tax=Sphingomonas sp. MMS24-J13 TaxID=3238686 RepID=UPI0038514E97
MAEQAPTSASPGEAADRRGNIRLTTVLQIAKIITRRHEELCILRDISPNGVKAEIYHPVAIGESVTVEFRTGHAASGAVVWAHGAFIGVAFADMVSVEGVLSRSRFADGLGRIRPSRITVDLRGRLRSGEDDVDIQVVDISLSGAKVLVDMAFRPDMTCDLWLPSLDRKRALVRWSRAGTAGLMFAAPIPFRDFASWRRLLVTDIETQPR